MTFGTETETELESKLCCCEYYNNENERYHILECCCNCKHLDLVFDRLVSCKRIDPSNSRGMLLTFQDRLRIPWHGGAKRLSLTAIVPALILPVILTLATINPTTAALVSISLALFIGLSLFYQWKHSPRTNFFFMWSFWSIIYIVILFEFTVPMMEILPEENFILVLFVVISLVSFQTCKKRASLNIAINETTVDHTNTTEEQTSLLLEVNNDDEGTENGGNTNMCDFCRKYMQPRTFHCVVCQACISRRDHHNFWLNCCIGEYNHRYYLSGLVFGVLGFLVLWNLAMTAVCHPVLIFRIGEIAVMLPDDCYEVFDEFDIGLAFITSVYALIIAIYLFIGLIFQIYLISRGVMQTECRRGKISNRRSIIGNWKSFVMWFK